MVFKGLQGIGHHAHITEGPARLQVVQRHVGERGLADRDAHRSWLAGRGNDDLYPLTCRELARQDGVVLGDLLVVGRGNQCCQVKTRLVTHIGRCMFLPAVCPFGPNLARTVDRYFRQILTGEIRSKWR